MKNYPLAIQIWIIFAIITLAISLVLSGIIPMTLRSFFTKEIYSNIESAQDLLLTQSSMREYWDTSGIDNNSSLEDIRAVKHFVIYDNNQIILDSPLTVEFLQQIKRDISTQKNPREKYKGVLGDEKVFYVITKIQDFQTNSYLVSYMGDSYRKDLVSTLFYKLISLMGIIFLLSWIPALILSRYLSKPLVNLESRVDRLAKQDWEEPISLGRNDEIGKLGDSMEMLRNQLIRQDEAERTFLQHVSHELKTPVMVIRSYSQAIKDGIFPKGDLDHSIEVIDVEAERLDKKIRNLLYFSKLDYMTNHQSQEESFSLDSIIKDVVDRLAWNKVELDWHMDLSPLNIKGDKEQWRIVLENLIDNQIRYAESQISIDLYYINNSTVLEIWNDGPPIEAKILKNLFVEYNKGNKGEFGLGLAIVNRIIKIHNSTITAKNEDIGVRFIIEIPNG